MRAKGRTGAGRARGRVADGRLRDRARASTWSTGRRRRRRRIQARCPHGHRCCRRLRLQFTRAARPLTVIIAGRSVNQANVRRRGVTIRVNYTHVSIS